MTPLDTYKKGIEETEEHFENIYYGKDEFGGRNFVSEHAVKDFLDMNKHSTLDLLRALREEVDKMNTSFSIPLRGRKAGEDKDYEDHWLTGRFDTVADTLATIDTLISNIENNE